MKLILVNQRYGHTRTIVIRGWMKGFLSLCLMGAPVALGYLGYELAFADAGTSSLVSQESAVAPEYTFLDITDGELADPVADSFPEFRVVRTHFSSLFVMPQLDVIATRLPGLLTSFQHGRLIDPASYFHRTLH